MKILEINDYYKDGFPVVINEPNNHKIYPLHVHDYVELVIVRGGNGVHIVDGSEYPITTGDIFVITGELTHGYLDTNKLKITNIMMDFNSLLLPFNYLNELPGFHALFDIEPKLRENHKFKSRLRITEEQIATVNVFLHRIRSEMDAKNTGYKAVVTGVLVELLVFLSRSYFNCDISKSVLEVSRLGMIITKIKTDFDSNITLDTLALMANMSKWTFLRSFKKVFDMTPIQYLMNIRIAKATTMLLDTNKSISEIAMEVGFNDSNYFSRQFKKIKGMNPRSFRASFIFKAGSARNP